MRKQTRTWLNKSLARDWLSGGSTKKLTVYIWKKRKGYTAVVLWYIFQKRPLYRKALVYLWLLFFLLKAEAFACDSLLPEAVWSVFFSLLFLSLQARNHNHFNFSERFHMHKHSIHSQRNRLLHVTVWPLCGLMCVLWYWVIIVYFCSCLLTTVQHQPQTKVFIRMLQLWY